MKIDIGIGEEHRERIAEALSRVLADSYTLYLKTHNFHWNVTGPQFQALHTMFEQHYTELALAVDEVAERIRTLGIFAPGSYAQFSKLTSITEETGVPSSDEMVRQLVQGHEAVARTARSALSVAQEGGDEASLDLLVGRVKVHEKTAWMLRSMLGESTH